MKKNLFTLLMVFGCIGLFAACSSSSKDDLVEIDSPLVGVWNVSDAERVDVDNGYLYLSPLTVEWIRRDGVDEKEFALNINLGTDEEPLIIPIPVDDAAHAASNMGSMAVSQGLSEIEFHADGNITALYSEQKLDLGGEIIEIDKDKLKISPKGLASFRSHPSNDQIKLTLNINEIVKLVGQPSLKPILENILGEGVTVNYKLEGDHLFFSLDKETIEPYMQGIIEVLDKMDAEDLGDTGSLIKGALADIPRVLGLTEKLTVKLSLENK